MRKSKFRTKWPIDWHTYQWANVEEYSCVHSTKVTSKVKYICYHIVKCGMSEDIHCHWSFLGAKKHHNKRVCPSIHLPIYRAFNAFSLMAERLFNRGVSQQLMPYIWPYWLGIRLSAHPSIHLWLCLFIGFLKALFYNKHMNKDKNCLKTHPLT